MARIDESLKVKIELSDDVKKLLSQLTNDFDIIHTNLKIAHEKLEENTNLMRAIVSNLEEIIIRAQKNA